jgi:autotransporter-associated beta strand protein
MTRHRLNTRIALLAASSLIIALAAASAPAVTTTWTGATSGSWNVAGNWNPSLPVSGNSLAFAGTTPNNTTTNNIAGLTTVGINFAADAAAYTLNGNALTLNWETVPTADGGTGITHRGDIVSESANAQTINLPIAMNSSKHVISTGTAGLHLGGALTFSTNLGPATQPKGTSLVFSDGGGGVSLAGSGLANDASGILGGWATIGASHAALDGTGKVIPYAGYTLIDSAANPGATIADNANSNVRITTQSGTALTITTPTTHVNTITYGDGVTPLGAAQVISLGGVGAGNTLIMGRNGGFYNTSGAPVGSTVRLLTIGTAAGDGTLTAGDGTAAANINFVSTPTNQAPQGNAGVFTVNSIIADNGSQPVSVTVRGGYVTAAGANVNTFSGGLYIISGRWSQATVSNIGTGPVYIYPGGQVNSNNNLVNEFFIAGNGTTEQANADGGLGALRLFGTAAFTNNVTLMANAKIAPTNNGNNALTGRITGPGGLMVGGTNGTQGGGVLAIGKTSGASLRNNYAGDTIIRGHTGGTANNPVAVLRINANVVPSDNYFIMPHGPTGSSTGGPTGNLILDAQNADGAHNAVFDLNGTKQVINGLSSTATQPLNNIVSSSAPGVTAVLYLGDSNATATYDGLISEEPGAQLSIVKIGTGTQTFNAFNTYSGDTRVYNGTLSLAQAYLASTSDVHISSGGVLNLAFGGSNLIDSLYLNGVPQPAGVYTSANTGGRITGTGSLQVQTLGAALLPGDFDGDKDVDGDDLAVWRKNAFDNPGADADFDGDSDGNDFLIWQRQLGKTIPAAPVAGVVPEPGTLALWGLTAATWALAGRRRRR